MMSSEDEQKDENGKSYVLVHKLAFRTKKLEKLIKIIDDSYLTNCYKSSEDQHIRRDWCHSVSIVFKIWKLYSP